MDVAQRKSACNSRRASHTRDLPSDHADHASHPAFGLDMSNTRQRERLLTRRPRCLAAIVLVLETQTPLHTRAHTMLGDSKHPWRYNDRVIIKDKRFYRDPSSPVYTAAITEGPYDSSVATQRHMHSCLLTQTPYPMSTAYRHSTRWWLLPKT